MSGQYSDLIIRDKKGHDWQVHKLVVCARCQFFANAVKGDFKEISETNHVTGPKKQRRTSWSYQTTTPLRLKPLLPTSTFKDYLWSPGECPPEAVVLHHIEAYIIAEVYEIPGLKDLAYQRIVGRFVVVGGCPRSMILLAARRVDASLPESDRRRKDFLAFLSTMHLPGLMSSPLFQSGIPEFSAFSIDIAKALLENPEQIECKFSSMRLEYRKVLSVPQRQEMTFLRGESVQRVDLKVCPSSTTDPRDMGIYSSALQCSTKSACVGSTGTSQIF
ncbi:hypothetical protein IWX90DRAFT_480922 [Phyllosticta citrichinensis]|uniref:BTB domain-containing protein n=1 Tax=Phyllosticta citrichinensis TaxID=1130410 RepID=A0ABR1XIL1_9PEZI